MTLRIEREINTMDNVTYVCFCQKKVVKRGIPRISHLPRMIEELMKPPHRESYNIISLIINRGK